eukprot:CAMPEP_0178436476 /NCGR_PEP_ID=MMETSP0689_2-20121128/34459_1 /TAXON_ID=160604 /ORGANISM="Amphidinium massartii, Strain CS-259" /LENGTH=912 /DNA_ID=CAMNT_0020058573 /DNA_START=50 /DNA_END=2785 /DNA_ORIENTATION=-
MSSDPTILKCLSAHTRGEAIQHFEKVKCQLPDHSPWESFLCVGKHNLYFVSKDLVGLVSGEHLSYLDIIQVVQDVYTRTHFVLFLGETQDSSWGSPEIKIWSDHREKLLERIAMCWQAEVMYRKFEIQKFPLHWHPLSDPLAADNIQTLRVHPWKGHKDLQDRPIKEKMERARLDAADPFQHQGYGFFLREGFVDGGFGTGTFTKEEAWEAAYDNIPVKIPGGVQVQVHVHDSVPIMELEKRGEEEVRVVAAKYKQDLVQNISQFYVMLNAPYNKKMNRTSDIAMWDGWELLIRTQEGVIVCIILRRQYIPPLCDTCQDIAVMLHCPNAVRTTQPMLEVLIDECRTVADTLSPVEENPPIYKDVIQARLDALQFDENAYMWFEGKLNMTPCHRYPSAFKYVKSIVKILDADNLINDSELLDELDPIDEKTGNRKETPVEQNPQQVPDGMFEDAAHGDKDSLLEPQEAEDDTLRAQRLNENKIAWYSRVARYLAYCLDGGLIGDRFNLGMLVRLVGRGSTEVEKVIKDVIEFLLHVNIRDTDGKARAFSKNRLPLAQLLQDPSEFGRYTFNERVMRVLITEKYIQNEHRKKSSNTGTTYEKLQAVFLENEQVGIGLRTLLCRQILEGNLSADEDGHNVKVLVLALLQVMQEKNLSLASCATAALVNLSCGKNHTKTVLMSQGCLRICIDQLKLKDDDLTLYTLYLLVNMTKTPHQRAAVVSQGGVPLLVDILTSSYQNPRKHQILTQVASIIGQLCNDPDTRNLLSDDSLYPVVSCLLWLFDSSQPNTPLKTKVLFALRQLCIVPMNKDKVGQHAIPRVLDDLTNASTTPQGQECTMNAILLLIMLASIASNAKLMVLGGSEEGGRLEEALEFAGIQVGRTPNAHRSNKGFSMELWKKVEELKTKVQRQVASM